MNMVTLPTILTDRGLDQANPVVDVASAPAEVFVPVVKADADLPGGECRALFVGTAGTANLMQIDGTIRADFPLQAGYNPISCRQVRTLGTASDIWALY